MVNRTARLCLARQGRPQVGDTLTLFGLRLEAALWTYQQN